MPKLFDVNFTLLGKSLDFRTRRNALLAGNIANLETPGYKSKDLVFERALGEAIKVFSYASSQKASLVSGLSKKDALKLLRLNTSQAFARFALTEINGEHVVMASMDLLMTTLNPEELSNAMWAVAIAADGWEKSKGMDEF